MGHYLHPSTSLIDVRDSRIFIFDVSSVVDCLFREHRLSNEELETIFGLVYYSVFYQELERLNYRYKCNVFGFDLEEIRQQTLMNTYISDCVEDAMILFGRGAEAHVRYILQLLPGTWYKGERSLERIDYLNGCILLEISGI